MIPTVGIKPLLKSPEVFNRTLLGRSRVARPRPEHFEITQNKVQSSTLRNAVPPLSLLKHTELRRLRRQPENEARFRIDEILARRVQYALMLPHLNTLGLDLAEKNGTRHVCCRPEHNHSQTMMLTVKRILDVPYFLNGSIFPLGDIDHDRMWLLPTLRHRSKKKGHSSTFIIYRQDVLLPFGIKFPDGRAKFFHAIRKPEINCLTMIRILFRIRTGRLSWIIERIIVIRKNICRTNNLLYHFDIWRRLRELRPKLCKQVRLNLGKPHATSSLVNVSKNASCAARLSTFSLTLLTS